MSLKYKTLVVAVCTAILLSPAAFAHTAPQKHKHIMMVISAPSGTGKSVAMKAVMKAEPKLAQVVSVTTRAARTGEADGVDYKFIDQKFYKDNESQMIEKVDTYGNRYGVLRSDVDALAAAGKDVIIDVTYEGVKQLKHNVKDYDIVTVYMMPPSMKTLRERLSGRGTDSKQVVDGRMAKACEALKDWQEYDYVIVADTKENAAARIKTIYNTHAMKRDQFAEAEKIFIAFQAENPELNTKK